MVIQYLFNTQICPYLRFDALEDVTTVPAFAVGGDPSTACWKLPRVPIDSASLLPHFPETGRRVCILINEYKKEIRNSSLFPTLSTWTLSTSTLDFNQLKRVQMHQGLCRRKQIISL